MNALRVLVIDDQELVRDVLARLLRRLGAEVVTAREGESGLRRYEEARSEGRPFDVVFLDLTMNGGMGGKATIRELLRRDPDCRAIVCSGHASDPVLIDYEEYGFCARVHKPFRLDDLQRALREATQADGGDVEEATS